MTKRRVVKPAVSNKRTAISMASEGALFSVVQAALNMATENHVVKVAISSFLEGRGESGEWRLQILEAQLIPVEVQQGTMVAD